MVKRESPHANTAYGAPPNKMPGFPAQIAGTPTNRGEARRYEVRRGHDVSCPYRRNRRPCAACSTQNGSLIPFAARPNLDGMTCERDMAVFAGIPGGAALHFDGDDVRVRMVVQATRLRIEIQSTDLWSICRCGAAEDRF